MYIIAIDFIGYKIVNTKCLTDVTKSLEGVSYMTLRYLTYLFSLYFFRCRKHKSVHQSILITGHVWCYDGRRSYF